MDPEDYLFIGAAIFLAGLFAAIFAALLDELFRPLI